ncbi:hypothetical protein O3G_MSEX001213 [Manduca sexta]|uniref:Ig-like domain-containing protein n=2 Tax=Manduca sexta TaxID=7130 RepID=A0A922CCB7_MANSE|nr:hypothetical protein O3G_MSEX001213 [Manduca sexta]
MWFKRFIFLFYLFSSVTCKKSFTIVLDTTISMREEIDIIKANIGSVISSLNISEYENYIVVPFNDPDVGAPMISNSPGGLINSLNSIKTSGGVDCPENSLRGIETALRVSEPQSSILVFTDAYAKEYGGLNSILDLCRNKFSQVVIFLSGFCLASEHTSKGDLGVYYDVTRACSGSVYRFDTAGNLRQAFRVIKEMLKMDWNDVITFESFSGQKELTFQTDSLTTDVMLVISGEHPQLQIADQNGQSPKIEKIIDTRNSQVIQLLNLEVRRYTATVTSQGTISATLYRRSELPYQYGFSTILPRSIIETSPKPMPGRTNYILINVIKGSIQCKSLEIFDGFTTKVVNVEATNKAELYIAKTFVDPDKLLKILVRAQDSNDEEIASSTFPLMPQKLVENTTWAKPAALIIEPEDKLIAYGANLTVSCKVNGYPKPKIQWVDDSGREFTSNEVLLEIPSTYISYTTIDVRANMTVHCKCENVMGEDSQSTEIYVNRAFSFDVIQTPSETTIEYGSEGNLFCQVDAYPEATIKWYHNNTLIEPTDNLQLIEFGISIKNMSLEDAGDYTCEAENIANKKTFTASVHISGIEAPEILKSGDGLITLKPGDWTDVECRILKGKPMPQISWSYKSEYALDFESLPEGVFVENGKLKIPSIQKEHKGVYRCEASNMLGVDAGEVTIKILYSPIIKSNEIENMTVWEGDLVELPCDVTASPKATVRWEMSQDDVIIPFDHRHMTDRRNTHRFNALGKDSVAPYIEPPRPQNITAAQGSNVVLSCNILFGNPAPSLKWEFLSPNYMSTVLFSTVKKKPAAIPNAQREKQKKKKRATAVL